MERDSRYPSHKMWGCPKTTKLTHQLTKDACASPAKTRPTKSRLKKKFPGAQSKFPTCQTTVLGYWVWGCFATKQKPTDPQGFQPSITTIVHIYPPQSNTLQNAPFTSLLWLKLRFSVRIMSPSLKPCCLDFSFSHTTFMSVIGGKCHFQNTTLSSLWKNPSSFDFHPFPTTTSPY